MSINLNASKEEKPVLNEQQEFKRRTTSKKPEDHLKASYLPATVFSFG